VSGHLLDVVLKIEKKEKRAVIKYLHMKGLSAQWQSIDKTRSHKTVAEYHLECQLSFPRRIYLWCIRRLQIRYAALTRVLFVFCNLIVIFLTDVTHDNSCNAVVVFQVRNVQCFGTGAEQPLRRTGISCKVRGSQS